MYNNPGKAKSPSQPSIFEIASQIEDEAQYNSEAKAIINAYRKVENMPVVGSKGQAKKAEQPKTVPRKAESEYANKVKETLRELNANRKKEMETHKHLVKPAAEDGLSKLGPAERHLIQSGLKHLVKLLHKKY
jgi:hypothetical protein